ncbi:hypothetical protein [Variovorax atrisoli]|uniref:hypothetical protein n=1 Tax=Variovorax atrisoli TaxID=3394203 RepID=UPI00036638E5|nr:hypothetical protein [Variovorax paradoxus]
MSTFNPWKSLQALVAGPPLQIGTVTSIEGGVATIETPGGGFVQARGDTAVGQRVFFRGEVIEGPAPDLPIVVITI